MLNARQRLLVGATRDCDDGPVLGNGPVQVFDLVEGHMAPIITPGFDGLGAVLLRSSCNLLNKFFVGLEFGWIGSIVLGHEASIAKSSNLIDGCNWSEDVLVIAKACQSNFNARASNFAALDEHKLIGFREDHFQADWQCEPISDEWLSSGLLVWVEQANCFAVPTHVPAVSQVTLSVAWAHAQAMAQLLDF